MRFWRQRRGRRGEVLPVRASCLRAVDQRVPSDWRPPDRGPAVDTLVTRLDTHRLARRWPGDHVCASDCLSAFGAGRPSASARRGRLVYPGGAAMARRPSILPGVRRWRRWAGFEVTVMIRAVHSERRGFRAFAEHEWPEEAMARPDRMRAPRGHATHDPKLDDPAGCSAEQPGLLHRTLGSTRHARQARPAG